MTHDSSPSSSSFNIRIILLVLILEVLVILLLVVAFVMLALCCGCAFVVWRVRRPRVRRVYSRVTYDWGLETVSRHSALGMSQVTIARTNQQSRTYNTQSSLYIVCVALMSVRSLMAFEFLTLMHSFNSFSNAVLCHSFTFVQETDLASGRIDAREVERH